MVLTIGLTVELFKTAPKGFVPEDDTGLIMGSTEAAADISFPAMATLQQGLSDVILKDPAVDGVGSFIGGGGGVNSGSLFISLKTEGERPTAAKVIDRLAQEAQSHARHQAVHDPHPGSPRRRSLAARVRINSPCGTPISTSCRPGSRAFSTG